MAETRSENFKQSNLALLKVFKEKFPLSSDLRSKVDSLSREWQLIERVEYSRAPEPFPNGTEPHYENPPLKKSQWSEPPVEPKHIGLSTRVSSPFEERPRIANFDPNLIPRPILPQPRVETRANIVQETSPVLPPRSVFNKNSENELRPLPAIPKQNVSYYNTQYKTSRETKPISQPVKKVDEPLPMRFQNPPYVNVANPPEEIKSGYQGEATQNPYNTQSLNYPEYENRDEARRELKVFPHQDIGHGFGRPDEEMRFTGYSQQDYRRTIISQEIPPLPPLYQSLPEDLVETIGVNRPNIASPSSTKGPELPPKALQNLNNQFTAVPDTNPSYVNVPSTAPKEQSQIHFDNIIPTDKGRVHSLTEENSEQMKYFTRSDSEPVKSEEGYIILQHSRDDASPVASERIPDPREAALGVFNIRDLISEKTDLLSLESGNMKREVLIDKVSSRDEADFYEIVSNKSVFFLYLTDHNVIIQELLCLVNPIYSELHNKLSPFYNFNFSKLKVALGPTCGILDIASTNAHKKSIFHSMVGKRGESLDVKKSLMQMKISTSHIIYISQSGSKFDEENYARYINDRDQDMGEHFQRCFIPIIQGVQPLIKKKVNTLIVYLACIYKIKEYERLIPDAFKHDTEMLVDIKTSLTLCQRSYPEEVIPQVIELAEESKLRESVYFRVKVNNKMARKCNDTVLGISCRNIHLLSISPSEEIEVAYMWSSADINLWSNVGGLMIEFKDKQKLLMTSPENEKLIHEILKMRVNPKKFLVQCK